MESETPLTNVQHKVAVPRNSSLPPGLEARDAPATDSRKETWQTLLNSDTEDAFTQGKSPTPTHTPQTSQLEPAQRKRNRKRHVEGVGGRRRADVRCRLSGDGWSWDPPGRRSGAEAGLWAACGSGGKVGSDRGDYGSALGSVGSKQRTLRSRLGAALSDR